MYNVLIDRSTLTKLIVGLSVIGLLLFFGGYLAGLHSQLEGKEISDSDAADSRAPAPASSASTDGASAQSGDAPADAPAPRAESASSPPPAEQAVESSSPSSSDLSPSEPPSPAEPAKVTTLLPPPPPPPSVESDEPGSDASSAPGAADSVAPETGEFSLQVGAYFIEEHLNEALRELQDRGYTPKVVPVKDANDRDVFTVRLGEYGTREEAEEAKTVFEAKENLSAFVRSADA